MIYRAQEGMWAWILHRATGLGIYVFLLIHVLETATIGVSPALYDKIIALYRNPFFLVAEIGLFAGVLFHALNGLRIILIDFWTQGPRLHRQLLYVSVALLVVVMIPVTVIMISHMPAAEAAAGVAAVHP